MAKVLCWEECLDGRYCKNYRLKNKSKCYFHYSGEDEGRMLEFFVYIVLASYITFLTGLFYSHHSIEIYKLIQEFDYQLYTKNLSLEFQQYLEYFSNYI